MLGAIFLRRSTSLDVLSRGRGRHKLTLSGHGGYNSTWGTERNGSMTYGRGNIVTLYLIITCRLDGGSRSLWRWVPNLSRDNTYKLQRGKARLPPPGLSLGSKMHTEGCLKQDY